jgi:hypothetical protein
MIVKPFSTRIEDVSELTRLLALPQISDRQKSAIEKELRLIRAGDREEAQAAYELDALFRDTQNHALLHGVRLVVGDDVAQIDHMVVTRVLEVFLIETKSFSGGVKFDKDGMFTAFHDGRPIAMPSPVAQNERHCRIFDRAAKAGQFTELKRLGMRMPLKTVPVVLIGNRNRLTRPEKVVPPLDQVMKIEQFSNFFSKSRDSVSVLQMSKLIATDTLIDLASSIAAANVPITFKWSAKFGIVEDNTAVCACCGVELEDKVLTWCKRHAKAFQNQLLCKDHQPKVPSRWAKKTKVTTGGDDQIRKPDTDV